jgi:cell division protein FtsW
VTRTGTASRPQTGDESRGAGATTEGLSQRSWTGARGVRRYLDRPYTSVQLLLLAGTGLVGFGGLMAASTTIAAAHEGGGSMWSQLIKQIVFLLVGVPVFYVAVRLSPRAYRVLAYPALFVSVIALIAVLVPGIGVSAFGARRWIDLGPIEMQPSEFAKLAILLWGADLLARKQELRTLRLARQLLIPLVPGFVLVVALVMLEPDLGTTACFVLILLGLLWMVGAPLRYFVAVLAVAVLAVGALAVSAPYRLQRLLTFTDPFKDAKFTGFHTVEGLYSLASGGIFGVGLGNGSSKYLWVPNANTDYVFSVIGEELGLIGSLTVVVLFGLFTYSAMRIARRSRDPFVRLVAGTAAVWICGQALINMGYVTALLPVTGIPLPFISAGGASLLSTFIVFGMLVSFARGEPAAAAAAHRAAIAGQRSRTERWLRLAVPKPYLPPRRPSASSGEAGVRRPADGRGDHAVASAGAATDRRVPPAAIDGRVPPAARESAPRGPRPVRPVGASTDRRTATPPANDRRYHRRAQ